MEPFASGVLLVERPVNAAFGASVAFDLANEMQVQGGCRLELRQSAEWVRCDADLVEVGAVRTDDVHGHVGIVLTGVCLQYPQDCAHNVYMETAAHPNKIRNQMARANRLVEVIETLPGTAADHLEFALSLTQRDWADKVAVVADHRSEVFGRRVVLFEDRTPSPETIEMAITLLDAKAINEELASDDLFAAFAGMDQR